MGNAVVHFEINGPEDQLVPKFYGELFGWHSQPMPEMNYTTVDTHAGDGINGGFGKTQDAKVWSTVYVEVPDPQAALDKAVSLGGKVVLPVMEIPDTVTLAQFSDLDGNVIGLVKSAQGAQMGPSSGSNPALGWFEIHSLDPQRAWKFYRELFDWHVSESQGEGYVYGEIDTHAGSGINGGISSTQTGQPFVVLYAAVDDCGKYLARALELGAQKVMEPAQVQDNLTVAMFKDPQGCIFGLFTYKG